MARNYGAPDVFHGAEIIGVGVIMTKRFACAPYNPKHGDRIRILLEYEEVWRPFLWLKFAKDGSIYLGPRKVEITELRHGVARPIENRQLLVASTDGELVTNPDELKKAKISFQPWVFK